MRRPLLQGRFGLHFPVHNVPGHMSLLIAKKELENKRKGVAPHPYHPGCAAVCNHARAVCQPCKSRRFEAAPHLHREQMTRSG